MKVEQLLSRSLILLIESVNQIQIEEVEGKLSELSIKVHALNRKVL